MEGITVQSTSHVAWFAFAAGFYRDGSELHVFLFPPTHPINRLKMQIGGLENYTSVTHAV